MRCLVMVFVLAMLVSCSQSDVLQKFSSPEDQATARRYINLLRAHDYDPLEKAMDPTLASPSIRDTLTRMSALIPAQEPTSVELVGVQSSAYDQIGGHESAMVNTTFEYRFGDKWLLINVAIKTANGVSTIIGFHVNPEHQSVKSINQFTLEGKSVFHYLVMAMAIFAVLGSLYALFVCIRTKLPRRKWLWILFIVFGVGRIGINWTTGQMFFLPISLQMFSASAFAPLYGPWLVSFSLPLGAILFLLQRRKLEQKVMSPSTQDSG